MSLSYRTRKNLTYKEKVEVLELVEKGEMSRRQIAENYGIARTTLSKLIKDSETIAQLGTVVGDKSRVRTAVYGPVESQLLMWLNEEHPDMSNLTAKTIKEKAKEIANGLQIDFPASTGWLDSFRKRYGFQQYSVDFPVSEVKTDKETIYIPYGKRPRLALEEDGTLREEHGEVEEEEEGPHDTGDRHEEEEEEEIVLHEHESSGNSRTRLERETVAHVEGLSEYTKEGAMEAFQYLMIYFMSNSSPPGTFELMDKLKTSIEESADVQEYVLDGVEETGENIIEEVELKNGDEAELDGDVCVEDVIEAGDGYFQ